MQIDYQHSGLALYQQQQVVAVEVAAVDAEVDVGVGVDDVLVAEVLDLVALLEGLLVGEVLGSPFSWHKGLALIMKKRNDQM